MGARGPAPKPTALRVAQGNPGKRTLNDREPVPPPAPAGGVAPPAWLGKSGRKVWDALAPAATAMKVLTTADVLTFARYCETFGRWLDLKALIATKYKGSTSYVRTNADGVITYAGEIPEGPEFRKLGKDLLLFEREFGLTPAARTRIQVDMGAGAAGAAEPAPGGPSFRQRFLEGPFPIAKRA